ncbi:hypothetical protein EB796_006945 [Bugula neritina]|uniref:Uncharacterized protein n=1 Tax=Bugula neritina TaxID=10212 RepID=A0A7J7KAW8_BUGNE|nr:hypothetical protein EB796_006945 [Bugula neritina]
MGVSEYLCCCLDVATGAILTGLYTCMLSLAFLAIGIDSTVQVSRESHSQSDAMVMNAIHGLLIALSVIYGVASISLVLGASRKFKKYTVSWIVITPLWTIVVLCYLVILPAKLFNAIKLTGPTSRICGTVFIVAMNTFCMVVVCMFFVSLVRSPVQTLKSLGVVEALETGFSNGYSRLRESFRPKKSKLNVGYNSKASATSTAAPELAGAVVLNPNKLEVTRSSRPSTRQADVGDVAVSEHTSQPLEAADQLDYGNTYSGLSNPAFTSEI